ncbi:MAG: hypothetical protein LWY06_05920 [Firmicutes bacterium]|nr:hypothetical protein [Bacillota bacterium]
MSRGKAKKIGDPKCRACNGLLEGRAVVKIGGRKWHLDCAVKAGKHIPTEYKKTAE